MDKSKYVGPWSKDETYTCRHGVPIPYRWVGETEDDSIPETGDYECKKCQKGWREQTDRWARGDFDFEGDYGPDYGP